jgi:hypothetical protein
MSQLLHSALTPEGVADALRRTIDEEKRTLFSFSGYRGSLPVLGDVTSSTFRLQRRGYWRNDFAPHLYGQFRKEGGGTRIETYFDTSRWVKMFMRFWLAGVALLGGPMFVLSLLDRYTGSHYTTGDTWVGIIVFPAMVAWGFLLPKIGRLFGRGGERFLLEFVQQTLAAQVEGLSGRQVEQSFKP